MAGTAVAKETTVVEFGLLGPLQAVRSGRPVPLGGPRQRAVLGFLLLHANTVVSLDRLVDAVWDGRPPDGATTTVQTYVFHLRQALEPDRPRGAPGEVLITRDPGYLLHVDPACIDAAVFETRLAAGRAALDADRPSEAADELRGALKLWRGPVLADLAGYGFVQPEAARLDELRLAATEARIDADLALGRHAAVVGELDQLVTAHPLREHLHGQLMLALYRSGRQADALAAYRRARELLTDELGIDPGEPLQRLHQAILAHDPALDWQPAEARAAPDQIHGAETPSPLERIRRWSPRRLVAAGAALAVVAAGSLALAARARDSGQPRLAGNSVGVLGGRGFTHEIPVGQSPDSLAYGDGAVWATAASDDKVVRIDRHTHAVVDTIPVGSDPSGITVTGDDVWVANSGDNTVSRINTQSNTVVQPIEVGNQPVAIASGQSGVWVANRGDNTVSRIDPTTGKVIKTVTVGGGPDGIAVSADAVWVANGEDRTVSRVDPRTYALGSPILVGAGPEGVAVTADAVWVTNALDRTVSKIDPVAHREATRITVGDGPRAIVASKKAVWVSNEFDGTLTRIDPRTGDVTRRTFAGSSPRGLAFVGSDVWVAARPFTAASHRGGTLTVATSHPPPIDPASPYGFAALKLLTPVYNGLVGLPRAGSSTGVTLVPNLATALPLPTDGGRTYTFTVRQGIRYSTGALVQPADFRRGVERQFTAGGDYAGHYVGIVGGQACLADPKHCDLSRGIVTDDAARTVTFHLTGPDPDILYKLAGVVVTPVPPGSQMTAVINRPLPGTGPYMISSYRPNQSLTLTRNPYFHQWSYAAQPDGYPDVIQYRKIVGADKQVAAVNAGTADLVDYSDEGPDPRILGELARRYPTRLHSTVAASTNFVTLNTRVPPFDNVLARRALSYAVDREKLALLFQGPVSTSVTCQALPPGLPGYRPYCPFTTDGAADGPPDLAKARYLVATSHTANIPVTVWANRYDKNATRYLVEVLQMLGYRARHNLVVPEERAVAGLANSRSRVQIGISGWVADFPTPSGFFRTTVTCASFKPGSDHNINVAKYCQHMVDRLLDEAQRVQATDPARARELWAKVDRIITDDAPWIPMFNQKATTFVSARLGHYQAGFYGPLLDQMWVR